MRGYVGRIGSGERSGGGAVVARWFGESAQSRHGRLFGTFRDTA